MTVEARQKSNVPTYTFMAPTIFGISSGKFRRYTTQLPVMVNNLLNARSCLVLGTGGTRRGRVHVEDLAMFFMSLPKHPRGEEDPVWTAGRLHY
jgi:nucleoside-diphosphate-sugar epimerase